MLVGIRSNDGSTDLETLLRVQRGDFKPPGRVRPDLLPELGRIIERAMRFLPDERYPTADDMLVERERVLLTHFGAVGQTELKHYLVELGQHDGVPPIGRAKPIIDDHESSSGAELVEGNAVVLADAKDDIAEERTDLAELSAVAGDEPPRFTRRTVDLARPGAVAREGSGGRGTHRVDMFSRELTPPGRGPRRVVEALTIPEGAVQEEPPERFRRKKSRTGTVVMVFIAIAGGGFGLARYLGLVGSPKAAPTSVVMPSPAVAAPAPPLVLAKPAVTAKAPAARPAAPPAAAKEPAVPPAVAPKAAEPAKAAENTKVPEPAKAAESPRSERSAEKAAAEKPAHKSRGSRERDVFKESAKRVRSLSQGMDQFPPGT